MYEFFRLLVLLLFGHFMADFFMQTEFQALGKSRKSNPYAAAVPWYYCLTAHAAIYAGVIGILTGSLLIGLIEFVIHWIVDHGKCEGWYGIHVDQGIHLLCKVAYAVLLVF